MERLADALQDATDVSRITPEALAAHPALPDRLFIGARVEGGTGAPTSHVFVHNLATDEITELLQIDHNFEPHRSLHVSADGRWLFVHSVDQRASSWHLHLYNIRTGDILTYSAERTMAYPGYDLSADGEWLVRVDDGFLPSDPVEWRPAEAGGARLCPLLCSCVGELKLSLVSGVFLMTASQGLQNQEL